MSTRPKAIDRDARRRLQAEALDAALDLDARGADAKGLPLALRQLGLGQVLAIYARKPASVGHQLARWLARQLPPSALDADNPNIRQVAEEWRSMADRRQVQRLELEAIAFADALSGMHALVQAAPEQHLPTWSWRAEPRDATATRVAVALELGSITIDQAREGDRRELRRLRLALGDTVDLEAAEPTLAALRCGQSHARICSELKGLPPRLRHHGLAGALGVLYNKARTPDGRPRSALANLIIARLRGHPAAPLADLPVEPVDVARIVLGIPGEDTVPAAALATARVLEDESLRWAQALKHAVTTLAEER